MDGIRKKRYNIGLVVANIEDDFSNAICKGAIQAAEELDDNLFIMPAKYLDFYVKDDPNQAYEYQYNTLISYARVRSLDLVLLCLSTIGCTTTYERCMQVLKTFDGIPLILIASGEDGYSSVRYANHIGLGEGIRHMIREEGRRRIGMIVGRQDNPDAIERLETYRATLTECGIPLDDSLIKFCDLDGRCEAEAESLFTEFPELDGIVCGNDSIAATVYKCLTHHNISIGTQISVIGFDDLEQSKHLTPPLATVRASAKELGLRAVVQGHRKLQSGTVHIPETFLVNTKFIFRESIGSHADEKITIQRQQDEQDWLFEKAELADASRQLINMNHHMNILSRDMLMLDSNEEESYKRVLNCLAQADIKSCFLYLLKEPTPYYHDSKWELPEQVYLRAFLRNGNACTPNRTLQLLSIHDIFCNNFLPEERKTFVMIDLYSRETQYGFMVCDIGFRNFHYIEFLCYQISIAIRLIHMLADTKSLLEEKDDLVSRLQAENLQLDAISGKDELTGILNRRGFYKKAASYILRSKHEQSPILFAYADLNYLKQINDHFGHREGDFALQACAQALEEIFPEGLVGRIGGDEFAVLAPQPASFNATLTSYALNERLSQIVHSAQKSYHIRISIGIFAPSEGYSFDLKEAVEKADARLYEEKQKKPPFNQ